MNIHHTKPSLSTPLARRWFPLFALFVVHNLEEIVLDLPAWGRVHIAFFNGLDMSRSVFGGVVVALCAVLFGLAYVYRRNLLTTVKLMATFLAVMLCVFLWHLGISLYTHSVQPGVITAILFIPFYAYWLVRLLSRAEHR
jgi:hypothetical protein